MKVVPQMFKKIKLTSIIICLLLIAHVVFSQGNTSSPEDTSLSEFSIEDLVKMKKLLEQERDDLINAQEKDLQQGVELSKDFLTRTREENQKQDMILIRVAEYYIEESKDEYDKAVAAYNREYEKYEKQLEAFQEGKLKVEPEAPQFPQRNYQEAVAVYDLLLKNFPESELVDEALYNKAFLLSDMGEEEASQDVYEEIIDKYPESDYAPEAYMQLAEFYFQPKIGQDREETIRNLNKAAQLYKDVLNFKESPRYDEALYKLGWSYYRLAAVDPDYYNDAILYFTMVVEDVEKFKSLDPEGKYVKANIKPEALQYIAASFVDTAYTLNGVEKANNYLQNRGTPSYGVNVLSDMGDLYARIVDYDKSIDAYQTLLNSYPDYVKAPMIQKKIADVYAEANQPEEAYQQRLLLFNQYNPKSEWYAKVGERDIENRISVLDEASRLSEEALRSNVIYQLNQARQAEEAGEDSAAAYTEFAELASDYLETFPTHENAYEINWSLAFVLDTELNRYRDAFEEYIRVSNDYLEDEHRLDAATNAIAVAQTLVDEKRTTTDTAQIAGMDLSQLTAQELTEEEKLLTEAYDNYIKLFPNEEQTASYLASAGALYYQHRQYNLARKYYKTMVTKFPEAQQKSVGLLSLMNSYFFLGKYEDAEFVAKKIVNIEEIPQDQIEIAEKRIGESIFKSAEKLEQEEQYIESAREYFRVYQEAGDYVEIVDLALFNSAKNFERANEWQRAISVYDTLVANFQDSKYRLVALGRIADAYQQMQDYDGVASTYERIYNLYPQSEDAEAALYNASLFYERAENWSDAIRVNNKYISQYPESGDSKDLLFENAGYYLKLDDLANANRIYEEFAQQYPDDNRTIEALYRRGEYYFDNNQYALAKEEFQKAINQSKEFERTGRNPNVLYASEAYFKLGEIEFEEFQSIQLSYPESNLRSQLQRKRDKLDSVVEAFTEVIRMGSLKGFEAMYKVAQAYEELANSIAEQELPPNLAAERELVERNRVFKASVPAYNRAVEEYKNVMLNIPVLAENLDVAMFDTTSVPTGTLEIEDTTATIEKESLQDSTREVALKWYNRAEEKISSLLYTVAERSEQFIHAYLRQESPLNGVQYLSYKKLLLERAVSPAVNTTLEAHLRNINTSGELELQNKFVRESKRKILLTNNILADEYGKLFKKAAEIYGNQQPTLNELVEGGEQATTPEGLNSMNYNDQMLNTIDYMNEFITRALNQYENTLNFARENQINNDAVLTTQDRLFNLAFDAGNKMLELADDVMTNRQNFENLADSTGNPKYQLGIVYLYDHEAVLRDYSLRELEMSYQISEEYEIDNVWTTLILASLVELDPAQYLGDLPKEKLIVSTDQSWLASKEYDYDWVTPQLDDADWNNATTVSLPMNLVFSGFDTLNTGPQAIWLYSPKPDTSAGILGADTLIQDTMATEDTSATDTSMGRRSLELIDREPLAQDTMEPTTADTTGIAATSAPDTLTAYFRKHFNLSDRAIDGWALITADDQYHFYLNGEYIKGDETGIYEEVDLVSYIELSDFLNVGENLIAIDVTDFDGPPRNGLRFYMELEMLPIEVTSAAQRIREKTSENVDLNRLRKLVILNKNRILTQ